MWAPAIKTRAWSGNDRYGVVLLAHMWNRRLEDPGASADIILHEIANVDPGHSSDIKAFADVVGPLLAFLPHPVLSKVLPVGVGVIGSAAGSMLAWDRSAVEKLNSALAETPEFWDKFQADIAGDPVLREAVARFSAGRWGFTQEDTDKIIRSTPPFEQQRLMIEAMLSGRGKPQDIEGAVRSELDALSAKADEAIAQQRQTNRAVKAMEDLLRRHQEAASRQEAIQAIRTDYSNRRERLAALGAMLQAFGASPDAQRVVQAGLTLNTMFENMALHAAGAVTGVGALTAWAGGLASLMSLASGEGHDPVIAELRGLDQKLDQMRAEMRQSFAIVNQKLDGLVDLTQTALGVLLQTSAQVAEARRQIALVQAGLTTMEQRLTSLIMATAGREIDARRRQCVGWRHNYPAKDIPLELFDTCRQEAIDDATIYASSAANLALDPFELGKAREIVADSQRWALPFAARYVAAITGETGFSEADLSLLPHPLVWTIAADAYLRIMEDWPQHAAALGPSVRRSDLVALRDRGEVTRRVVDAMGGAAGKVPRRSPFNAWGVLDGFEDALELFVSGAGTRAKDAIRLRVQQEVMSAGRTSEQEWLPLVPTRLATCPDFDWLADVKDQAPVKPPARRDNYTPAVLPHLDAPYPEEVRRSLTMGWVQNLGGKETLGSEKRQRITRIETCLKQLEDYDWGSYCWPPEYNLPKGRAIVRVTVSIRKPRIQMAAPWANGDAAGVTAIAQEVALDFPGGGRCRVAAETWMGRVTSSLGVILADPKLVEAVAGQIANAMASEPEVALPEWRIASGIDPGVNGALAVNEAKQLNGAHSLAAFYFAVGMPSAFRNAETRLFFHGPPGTALYDAQAAALVIECAKSDAPKECDEGTLRIARDVFRWTGNFDFMKDDFNRIRPVLDRTIDQAPRREIIPLVDDMLLRLNAALGP